MRNLVWGVGGVESGDTLYICGTHIAQIPTSGAQDVGLIDGTEGNPIPQGAGFDIGAYEFLSGFTLLGDLNNDGYVDIYDLIFITPHFGKKYPHPEWNATADAVPSNEIDIYDVVFVASRFT